MAFYPQLIFWCLLAYFYDPTSAFQHLKQSCINDDCSATRINISNPPVNLWDINVITEVGEYLTSLNGQNKTKVVVFASDTPGFFASQIDINILSPSSGSTVNATAVLDQYYANLNLLLSTPVIFIAEVNGRAWGAGDEHLLRMDMRFAGPDALLGAPEAAIGLIHVGGMQQLVRLIGPGLTAEYMLSAAQVPAVEAARIGWVNSAYDSADALRAHVDTLATRISLFNIEVIRATKASIAEQAPPKKALADDLARFERLGALPFVAKNVAEVLTLSHNQSKKWELNNNDNIVKGLY